MSKKIKTCEEFEAAIQQVPFTRGRIPDLSWLHDQGMAGRSYGLWKVLLDLLHDAIALKDWTSVGELLKLYDSVALAGRRSEMWEASYVAFLEDVRLPEDQADLRNFWRVCPPAFLRDIERDRGLDKERRD